MTDLNLPKKLDSRLLTWPVFKGKADNIQRWLEQFDENIAHAISAVGRDNFTPDIIEALVCRPTLYRDTPYFDKISSTWVSQAWVVDAIGPEKFTQKAIATMVGLNPDHPARGSYKFFRSADFRKQVSDQLAADMYRHSLSMKSCHPLSIQHYPKSLLRPAVVKQLLPEYAFQVTAQLPRNIPGKASILQEAMRYNPACYVRLPAEQRTQSLAIDCLQKLCLNQQKPNMVKSVIHYMPQPEAIPHDLAYELVTAYPSLAGILHANLETISPDEALRGILEGKDLENLHKNLATIPADVLYNRLAKGYQNTP